MQSAKVRWYTATSYTIEICQKCKHLFLALRPWTGTYGSDFLLAVNLLSAAGSSLFSRTEGWYWRLLAVLVDNILVWEAEALALDNNCLEACFWLSISGSSLAMSLPSEPQELCDGSLETSASSTRIKLSASDIWDCKSSILQQSNNFYL